MQGGKERPFFVTEKRAAKCQHLTQNGAVKLRFEI
jgi:hypothetical protein